MSNTLKTTLLLGLLTGLIMAIGQYLGGSQGVVLAFVFAAVMNFGAYWFSDRMVLRMNGAQPVDEAQAPELYQMVRNLTAQNNSHAEDLHHRTETPNAFATGRNPENAAVGHRRHLRLLRPANCRACSPTSWQQKTATPSPAPSPPRRRRDQMLANMLRRSAILGGRADNRDRGVACSACWP